MLSVRTAGETSGFPFEICHEESFHVSQCGVSLLIPSRVGLLFFFSLNGWQSQNPKKHCFGGYENAHKVCFISAGNKG